MKGREPAMVVQHRRRRLTNQSMRARRVNIQVSGGAEMMHVAAEPATPPPPGEREAVGRNGQESEKALALIAGRR